LARGESGWQTQAGPAALAYVSEIDGSVQPYGLYIPASYSLASPHRWRLDVWFHGRSETLSEVNFLDQVQRGGGPFVAPDTFVLQPYGRYCNANKFAGETDLFEALADVKRRFKIDENRIVIRGFSMGGAACWHFAAHHASEWAAAAPGAGFAETAEYLQIAKQEPVPPEWWERKLWQLYDCPVYAANFFNVPVVAYSGEIDRQKQAADIMSAALLKEGIPLVHIIGPQTAHSYHPASKVAIDMRIDGIAAAGRNPVPKRVRLVTPTLKYNRQAWVQVDALARHWEIARVDAELVNDQSVQLQTRGVTGVTLSIPSGRAPFDPAAKPAIRVDGAALEGPPVFSDRSWTVHLRKMAGRWSVVETADDGTLRKRHNLQGPIDDAFMGSFLIVRPTGRTAAARAASWVESEMGRAVSEWRRQFRAEPRVKDDREVTDSDIAAHNLVLWGDPASNALLGRIAAKLPLQWTADKIQVGSRNYTASDHVLILIYPNPLNPRRYVVLNSGFTFREYDYLTNARQVPKLPDWAVVNLATPPGPRFPGRIVAANFFGEDWQLIEEPSSPR
jgi:dienelactone hydrolase